ncbi:MAG: glycosyltransferase [Thermoplasmata archaeon]
MTSRHWDGQMLVFVPALNRADVVKQSIGFLREHTSPESIVVVLDNGSQPPLSEVLDWRDPEAGFSVMRLPQNVGNYPTFRVGLEFAAQGQVDHIAFLHSDFLMYEHHWDRQVLDQFALFPDLGLIGCVGSNEIDGSGGRGLGTVSNFLGAHGAHGAEIHGKRAPGLTPAAVIDGCAMIFRTSVLDAIGMRANFPPHHFYDKLMSCQVLEAGYKVGVLGLRCDHLGMRTVGFEQAYHDFAHAWAEAHDLPPYIDDGGNPNWDLTIYLEAERQLLSEYRGQKGLIPCYVDADWTLHHGSPAR